MNFSIDREKIEETERLRRLQHATYDEQLLTFKRLSSYLSNRRLYAIAVLTSSDEESVKIAQQGLDFCEREIKKALLLK